MRCLALIIALVVSAAAQSGNEGSIEGTVADPSGAVLVGAPITARNLETSATFKCASNEHGVFRFLIVPVGRYGITAEHPGFTSFVRQDIRVTVGGKVNLPIVLYVGRRYHGLAVQVNKRLSHDFQFIAAYTLSKVIDDNPTHGALNPGPGDLGLLSDSLAVRLDRGAGDYDQRHRFVLSGIWDLNYANHLPQPGRAILTGWQVGGILTVDSGQPYSGVVNFDLNNDGNAATDRTPGLARNTVFLPTTISVDPRLTRKVRFNERAVLQVSWDAFNVFNRTNISGVRTTQFSRSTSVAACGVAGAPCLVPQNAGAAAFRTPISALDPRIVQLSAKLLF